MTELVIAALTETGNDEFPNATIPELAVFLRDWHRDEFDGYDQRLSGVDFHGVDWNAVASAVLS